MNNKSNFETKHPFYSLVADNGLGLFCQIERLNKNLQYAKNPRVEKFDTRWAAEQVSIQKYNQLLLSHNYNRGYYTGKTMKLNWFFFRSDLSGQLGKIWLAEPDEIVRPIFFE